MQGTLAVTPTSDDWFDITLRQWRCYCIYDDGETSASHLTLQETLFG